ncbi:MAG: hypothetical protein ACRDXD_14575 [Acidimicrobiia bacterium]
MFIAGKPMKREGQLLNMELKRVARLATESRGLRRVKSGFQLPEI